MQKCNLFNIIHLCFFVRVSKFKFLMIIVCAEVTIGPDQQKVTYTVTSENGYSQTYMMICSKSLDQGCNALGSLM